MMRHFDKRMALLATAALFVGAVGFANSGNIKNDKSAGSDTTSYKMQDSGKKMQPSQGDIKENRYDRAAIVSFKKGTDQLTPADKVKLKNIVDKFGKNNIDKVELAVWSDMAFHGKDLAKSEQDLADKRTNALKNFLHDDLDVGSISTYNMAEGSNWLARTFSTDEAELKSVFAKEASAPMSREDFNLIKKDGAPGKAVAIVVPKTDKDGNLKTENK